MVFLLLISIGSVIKHSTSIKFVRETDTRFDTFPGSHLSALYDGNDTVFIVGGIRARDDYQDRVFKYSITTQKLDTVGVFLPMYNGGAALNGSDIIYFGGILPGKGTVSDVYRYSTVYNNHSLIGKLPIATNGLATAVDGDTGVVYTFGGYNDSAATEILRYDLQTNRVEQVGALSQPRYGASVVWDRQRKSFYIFGGGRPGGGTYSDIVEYNATMDKGTVLKATLDSIVLYSCAAFASDGRAYVLGKDALFCFNSMDKSVSTLRLDNYPTLIQNHACVYVPRLERIYIFGGARLDVGDKGDPKESALISYIDLVGDPDPETTTIATVTIAPQGPSLQFVMANTRLPVPVFVHSTVYDGNDSVYVIGGFVEPYVTPSQVLKFSISTEDVQQVGTFLPINDGGAVLNGSDILYFGGSIREERSTSAIFRYSLDRGNYSLIGNMSAQSTALRLVQDPDSQLVYMFGGLNMSAFNDAILAYNPHTNAIQRIGSGAEGTYATAPVWDYQEKVAYIFGGIVQPRDIVKFDPLTGHARKLAAKLPSDARYACAVVAEDGQTYIVGNEALMQFDPVTEQVKTRRVGGYPKYMDSHACVYANRRIIVIGGNRSYSVETVRPRNEISYIELGNTTEETPPLSGTVIGFIGFACVFVLVVIGIVSVVCRRHLKATNVNKQDYVLLTRLEIQEFYNGVPTLLDNNIIANGDYSEYFNYQPYDKLMYEMEESQFVIYRGNVLGSGQFGFVIYGTVAGQSVAVKTLKSGSKNVLYIKALLAEIKILSYIGTHEHIVNMVGAHTKQLEQGIIFLFVEFCELGDLENYLRRRKDYFIDCRSTNSKTKSESNTSTYLQNLSDLNPDSQITTCDLFLWSTQVTKAMEYLAGKKVIHGDLATRNILLFKKSCAKITDFGLAKQLYHYNTNYTKMSKETPLPWRSMALESLLEMCFSTESDVWSFGVTLWEIFSLGDVPYTSGIQFSMEFVKQLQAGLRLQKPSNGSEELYKAMLSCWRLRPGNRPTFTELKIVIEEMGNECNRSGCSLFLD